MENWKGIAVAALTLAAGMGLAGLAVSFNETAHPPSQGVQWLMQQGYTNVKGGEYGSYFNSCGKNIMSRTYRATNPEGERMEKTVCFGLFGPHSPLFGD